MAVWKMPPLPPKVVIQPPTIDTSLSTADGDFVFYSKGAKSLAANLLGLPQVALDAAGTEMSIIAHEVIVDAQENYVPVEFGDLKASGDSDEYTLGSNKSVATIAMWFGGVVNPLALAEGKKDVRKYALDQHENMEYHHPAMNHKTGVGGPVGGGPPGSGTGGPKYLERPLNKKEPEIAPRIAAAVGKALDINVAFAQFALLDT